MACQNHVKQIALATQCFESAMKVLPPSVYYYGPNDPRNSAWSPQARILPYLEEGALESAIDYSLPYDQIRIGGELLSATRIAPYLCPTEERDQVRLSSDEPTHYPVNYGFNYGVWLVFDPVANEGGDGAFFPNSRLQSKNFTDGSSKTLLVAEVKTNQQYDRDGATGTAMPVDSASALCGLTSTFRDSGHTEWVDGRVHQTGFTAAFTPNTQIACRDLDVDWTHSREGRNNTDPTYAAVTSRSYHGGGIVNVAMMDGSVHGVTDAIDLQVWRAMATRAGEEATATSLP
jgi:prepilin-type processing-associated H-X9-DG protein